MNKISDAIKKEYEEELKREKGATSGGGTNPEGGSKVEGKNYKRMSTTGSVGERPSILNRRLALEGGENGFRRVRSVLRLDKEEMQNVQKSTIEHIDKVRTLIEEGQVPPSALGDLAATMERSSKYKVFLAPDLLSFNVSYEVYLGWPSRWTVYA